MSAVLLNSRVVCPDCHRRVFAGEQGECPACGRRLVGARAPKPKRRRGRPLRENRPHANRGIPILMSTRQVEDAYRSYSDHGLSLRQVARELLAETGYRSEASLAQSLLEQFRIRGWPLRDRITATVTASTTHGLASSGRPESEHRAHRRRMRVERGEIRDVRCEAVKLRYPGKGERCRRAALAGESYCLHHSPDHRAAIVKQMAAMRERLPFRASAGSARSEAEVW